MPALLYAGGTAAEENDTGLAMTGDHTPGLKKRDGQEGYLSDGLNAGRIHAKLLQVLMVNGIIQGLVVKYIHRQNVKLFRGLYAEDIFPDFRKRSHVC